MENTKYGKYVLRKSVTKPEPWPTMEWIGETDYQTNVTFMITRVMEPCEMEEYPHSHDFDMYLHFVSYDYEHMDELFAEIEIGLGEEREMHTITSPTSVYIPAGLVHCPLIFKRVDKPVILFHTSIASKYIAKKEDHGKS
ncbi:MAG TPA: hypothetical protein G4O15_08165 [Dehalococcoidia bacterium]|nr:hypothetical protein [Dehalococcoidia bacterium]